MAETQFQKLSSKFPAGKYRVKSTFIMVPKRPADLEEVTPLSNDVLKNGELVSDAILEEAGVDPVAFKVWLDSGAVELVEGSG